MVGEGGGGGGGERRPAARPFIFKPRGPPPPAAAAAPRATGAAIGAAACGLGDVARCDGRQRAGCHRLHHARRLCVEAGGGHGRCQAAAAARDPEPPTAGFGPAAGQPELGCCRVEGGC